jgi:hypothetical protein
MKILHHLAILVSTVCWFGTTFGAEADTAYPGDRMTLADARALKGVFTVNAADGASVAGNLAGIRDMGVSLRKQGVTPEFAVVFMGQAVRQSLVRPTWRRKSSKCHAAAQPEGRAKRLLGIARRSRHRCGGLVEVRVVGDGVIAVLAYQQRAATGRPAVRLSSSSACPRATFYGYPARYQGQHPRPVTRQPSGPASRGTP